jgi:hypothetical protein
LNPDYVFIITLFLQGMDYPYYSSIANSLKSVKRPGYFAAGGLCQLPLPSLSLSSAPDDILGLPLCDCYVKEKVQIWTQEINQLADIAISQPHAAYAGFVHGLSCRWNYLQRTIPDIGHLFQPLEDAIHQKFIPSLTGRPPCSKLTRSLLALPVRLGGLGLINPTATTNNNFQA